MSFIVFMAVAAAASAPATPPPLGVEQAERIRCVAALAIIANEQSRGVGGWEDLPPLASKGSRFAAIVGEAIVQGGTRTREMVRADMVAAVEAIQTSSAAAIDPDSVLRNLARPCTAIMNAAIPPPSLPVCAAMLTLAYDDMFKREGLSKTAKDLATFAAVLRSRARDEMRASGKSEAESDTEMGVTANAVKARMKAAKGKNEAFDFEGCFEQARP